jgi:hypothetical protein
MEPVMPPRTNKVDITYSPDTIDRVEKIVQLTGESRANVFKRAVSAGLSSIEGEIAQNIAFKNALGVQEKLKRRGQAWEEAIAILEAGELSDADRERVVQLLKRSAGGE